MVKHISVSVYYVAVRTIVLSRHGSNLIKLAVLLYRPKVLDRYCEYSFQQTQNISITFLQRRPNVFDVGPTLHKCYTNVLCLKRYAAYQFQRT